MTARAPRLNVGHDRRRGCLAARTRYGAQGWQPRKGGKINRLFCKPVCKPDAAGQLETGETEPTERDGIRPVRRGHRARDRRPETPETEVLWLITQRSRVEIPPRYQGQRPSSIKGEGVLHAVRASAPVHAAVSVISNEVSTRR